jgi:xanthine dehydrogenase accessory factor
LDERLFTRLSVLLDDDSVVVASVLATRGATPRKAGSRMLVTADTAEFSIGGGLAEARVVEAARTLLQQGGAHARFDIDLTGKPGAAGVCGGNMRIALRRWHGQADRDRAATISRALRAGRVVTLAAEELGCDVVEATNLHPDERLLIVGGGHCSQALFELARLLDFDLWVFDPRPACFVDGQFAGATTRSGDFARLADAFDTQRAIYAVLLNRDYASDVDTLRTLQGRDLAFLGMMGSRKRIAEVRAALPPDAPILAALHAPVGLSIAAQTPHEIAISILAQLVSHRHRVQLPG